LYAPFTFFDLDAMYSYETMRMAGASSMTSRWASL
jgi:hypothetical protein